MSNKLFLLIGLACFSRLNCDLVEDQKYWFELNNKDLKDTLRYHKPNTKLAKNILLFIGDGMGLSTVTASRIYTKTERGYFAFEKLPNVAALKTYSANKYVPDSCSTATAIFTGYKVNQRTGGVDSSVAQNDCEASLKKGARVKGVATWAQQAGKSTGFVTTTRVTHATPAALYAHTANRYWECEATMPPNATKCKDIARQLIEDAPGRDFNVIMGGGRQHLQSNVRNKSDHDLIDTWACYSKDGRDLIKKWILDKRSGNLKYQYVSNNQELTNVKGQTDYLLGIFANGHLNMDHERDDGPQGMPSLLNMTKVALNVVSKNPKGFFLMIEGGLIDFAHHRGKARKALSETKAFNEAIEYALGVVNLEETLIIVTSDHSHPLVISGYADRGVNITGIAQGSKIDGVPYTTLLYGLGGVNNYKYSVLNNSVVREDPRTQNTNDFEYSQQAGVKTSEVTHDGTDVLVYAQGPMAHLFQNVHEQTYVAHVMAYAARIGPYENEPYVGSAPTQKPAKIFIAIFLSCVSLWITNALV